MGDEADAMWDREMIDQGYEDAGRETRRSWYCEPCAVEVYSLRCPHCGKTKHQRR